MGSTRKTSESLAVENARRIATQLREERNDALALAQTKRELLDRSIALLETVRPYVPSDAVLEDGATLAEAIDALVERAAQ